MSDTPEVHRVTTQIRAPNSRRNDYGQVTEGRYIVADGKVTLTDMAGKPVHDATGKTYSRAIAKDGDARAIAAILTKEFRKVLLGKSAPVVGFGSPIKYPKTGIM